MNRRKRHGCFRTEKEEKGEGISEEWRKKYYKRKVEKGREWEKRSRKKPSGA